MLVTLVGWLLGCFYTYVIITGSVMLEDSWFLCDTSSCHLMFILSDGHRHRLPENIFAQWRCRRRSLSVPAERSASWNDFWRRRLCYVPHGNYCAWSVCQLLSYSKVNIQILNGQVEVAGGDWIVSDIVVWLSTLIAVYSSLCVIHHCREAVNDTLSKLRSGHMSSLQKPAYRSTLLSRHKFQRHPFKFSTITVALNVRSCVQPMDRTVLLIYALKRR